MQIIHSVIKRKSNFVFLTTLHSQIGIIPFPFTIIMKKFLLLISISILSSSITAQTFPLDFELPEDDSFVPFNGATVGVVVDPTDANNSVLQLDSVGNDFDGAAAFMQTYIDLSDDSNNTITLDFWTPNDAVTRTHLLKLEGATTGPTATELYFNTTGVGWETISLNFGAGLPTDYLKLVLFADAGVGNNSTGVYYIDNINGPNGASVPIDPIPSVPAPIPNVNDSEVFSIYNDSNGFTNTFQPSYSFGSTAGEPDLDPSAAENKVYKFNFGIEGFGQGVEPADVYDISTYSNITFDYWAGNGLNGFNFVMINQGLEYTYKVGVDEPIVTESWVKVQIPMAFFTALGFNDSAFFQWKIGPLNNSVDNNGVAYIDNFLITQNTLSTNAIQNLDLSVYPNPSKDAWNISITDSNIQAVEIFNTLGQSVKTITVKNNSLRIDASDLAIGIYFAIVQNENNQFNTVKLIKN